jgi:myosin-5
MRDSWAKALYEKLFNWLVDRLNETIKPSDKESFEHLTVGLLDIYGFEVFEVNGFEQIMINYTNEKLHQLYIVYVFKEEA